MLRVALFALLIVALIPISSAFAEGKIVLNSDQKTINANDTILVYGKITGVTKYVPLQLSVKAPDGETVFSPTIQFDSNGEFKRLIHHPMPSFKIGTYTVTASHEDVPNTVSIKFEVVGTSLVKDGPSSPGTGDGRIVEGLEISATAMEGSDTITITGNVVVRDTDVTLLVHSPNGNLVTVSQVTPNENGEFSIVIKTGGPLWTEDGVYTITANQGIASEFEDKVEVEIIEGRVIPEFGTIAAMILVVSIMSIIVITAKSKLSLIPRI
ncbi:MAG: PEFG-CTERM sorting domain-containing protein [Nitrosopumilaceae archaeon]|nr:PEFG-CTERM sorting domain-containing protein [Nitrosopumilaceae archaeon]